MAVSFLSPSRTVLLVSDEFLSIYKVTPKNVTLVKSLSWEEENFAQTVSKTIVRDCGKKPVLILNDMVEQHYRKERVIRTGVSVVDRSAMLKRKLNIAFPNYPIRAAYPLKEKIPKTDKQPASDIYIFAAVANNSQITQTIDATKKSLASVAGFSLLPVEASSMVKALSLKLGGRHKKTKKKATWAIFVGQHKNGSVRQVLTKNGELALTRMSPIVENDQNPELWAQELYTEFKSTMSYLGRFGYDPDDGLDVFVVANPAAGEALRSIFEEDCNLNIMTLDETAKALGMPLGLGGGANYADPLHVAWIGRKSRFILPMRATEVDEVSKPRQVAMLAALLLFAGAAYLGYETLSKYGQLSSNVSEIEITQRQKAQLDAQLQREVQRLEEVGFDARLVQSSLAVYEEFEKGRIKTQDMFKGIGKALGKDLRVDSIVVEKIKPTIITDAWGMVQNQGDQQEKFEARLKMTYPSTADIDRGNQEVEDLSARIATVLPGYEVRVTKFLKDYEYTEGLVVEAGDLDQQNIQQDFVAEIMIEGAITQ